MLPVSRPCHAALGASLQANSSASFSEGVKCLKSKHLNEHLQWRANSSSGPPGCQPAMAARTRRAINSDLLRLARQLKIKEDKQFGNARPGWRARGSRSLRLRSG